MSGQILEQVLVPFIVLLSVTAGFTLSWVLLDFVSFEVCARLYQPKAPVDYICVEDGVRFFTADEFAALRTNGAIVEREPSVFVFHGDFNWSGGECVVEPFEQFLKRITTAEVTALRRRYRRGTRDVHIRLAYIARRRMTGDSLAPRIRLASRQPNGADVTRSSDADCAE